MNQQVLLTVPVSFAAIRALTLKPFRGLRRNCINRASVVFSNVFHHNTPRTAWGFASDYPEGMFHAVSLSAFREEV